VTKIVTKKKPKILPTFFDDLPDEITMDQLLNLSNQEFLELLERIEAKQNPGVPRPEKREK